MASLFPSLGWPDGSSRQVPNLLLLYWSVAFGRRWVRKRWRYLPSLEQLKTFPLLLVGAADLILQPLSRPVNNHSMDFPNSWLILRRIAAPISPSPRSIEDK